MKNLTTTLTLWWLALAAVPAMAQGALPAAAVDTSDWTCEFCPFAEGYRGDYAAGVTHVSEDAAKFGDATGYDEQGAYVNLDGQGSLAGERYRLTWAAEDLGLDSRAARVSALVPGGVELRADYRELPHNVFDTTATVFAAAGDSQLNLPAGWQTAGLTSGFSALAASLQDVNIASERKTLELAGRYRATPRLRLSAQYRRHERDGNDVVGGAYFTQASLLPRNLDQHTDEVDVGLTWSGDRGHVTLGWLGSWFQNDNWALTWQNPFTSVPGAQSARQAQAPDNSASQVSARGQYRLDAFDTVLNASGAFGRMEQNDALAAYTINPLIAANPLPRTRQNAEVETTALALSVSARPHARARVRASWRYDERDNQSPQSTWERVIADSFVSGDAQTNTPYGFERMRLKLDGDVEVRAGLRLSAGYERYELDRDFQEVAEQTEDSGWGEVRWRPNASTDLRLRAGNAKRDIDRYATDTAAGFGQNPLLRKYNLAYRYREFADLRATASLPNAPLTVSANARYADDSYSQSTLGLTSGRDLLVSADLDWAVSEATALYLTAGWHEIEAQQAGSEGFGAVDWRASNDDDFLDLGVGLRVRGIAERADLEFDYLRTDGSSDIAMTTAAGPSSFPALESTRDSFRVRLRYRRSQRLQGVVQLRYESFDSSDWALQNVEPATIPSVLGLGADPYDYDVFMISVGLDYFFGPQAQDED